MKVRHGFVSNSSSSSFIVIEHGPLNEPFIEEKYDTFVGGEYGETEFGWQDETYHDAHSKINFAYLQAENNPAWLAMLETVIKEHLDVSNVEWKLTAEYNAKNGKKWAYIDHQSAACEGQNTEMFENEHVLKAFLFNTNSYIKNGNDND